MASRPGSSRIRRIAWLLAPLWLLVLLLTPGHAQVGRALRAEARPGADGPSARFHLLAIGIDQYADEDDFAYYEMETDDNGNGILDSYEPL
jgi:hypothetical protein